MQEVESGDLGKILDRFEDDTLFIDANRHKWVEELAGHWLDRKGFPVTLQLIASQANPTP